MESAPFSVMTRYCPQGCGVLRAEEVTTVMAVSDAAAPRPRRTVARALGNVLIGIAVGLLAYYGITDVEARASQGALRTELRELGPVAIEAPPVVESAQAFDFEGWEVQDKAFWDSAKEGSVVGRLVIKRMGLDTVVVKGATRDTLKLGPGWIDTTGVPGETGNCAISGHRTTYGAPFRRLDVLKSGDVVELYTPYRRYRYRVSRSFSVQPWRVDVISPTEDPTLTLTACHPPYSARFRLIVQAKLVEARHLKRTSTAAAQ